MKICAKHPELHGDRDAHGRCKGCRADYYATNKAAILEKVKQYREANPDTVRETKRRQYEAKGDVIRARNTQYQSRNKEALSAKAAEWREANRAAKQAADRLYWAERREELNERRRQKYSTGRGAVLARNAAWRKANPDAGRRYRENNPATGLAHVAKRRAAKLQATPAWANEFFIQEAYALAKLREKVCGGKWHVDHIVPLRSKLVCGLHVEHNLRVIPAVVNLAKKNFYWPDMPEQGTTDAYRV